MSSLVLGSLWVLLAATLIGMHRRHSVGVDRTQYVYLSFALVGLSFLAGGLGWDLLGGVLLIGAGALGVTAAAVHFRRSRP